MSFHPLRGGFDQSLLGVGADPDLLDINRLSNKDYIDRAHYLAKTKDSDSSLRRTIITIVISAILFVTIVSIYDVLRNAINNHYARVALTDPRAKNTQQEITSTLIANKQGLISSIVFAILCIVIALIVIYILYLYLIALIISQS